MTSSRLLLDAGSGGQASHRLVTELFFKHFDNPVLAVMDDAARLQLSGPVAMSTDGFIVDPIIFPGGNIGSLAVHGTVNDVAMLGARPRYLTAGFILEEGLDMALLETIVAAMGQAAREAGVQIVAGDTKVAPKGALDKIFITTTGIGEIMVDPAPSGHRARPGDAVLLSGTMGDHGLAILSTRQGLAFETPIVSDCASLNGLVETLITGLPDVHTLRDPTRGGLATTLNEIAGQSGVVMELEEAAIPVHPAVAAGCSFLGLDPLYLANEGKLLCIVPGEDAEKALELMKNHPLGGNAARIGTIQAPTHESGGKTRAGQVLLRTPLGGRRLLGMLEGEQLPRIC